MTAAATRMARARGGAVPFLVLAAGVRADEKSANQNPPKIDIDIAACEQGVWVQTPGGRERARRARGRGDDEPSAPRSRSTRPGRRWAIPRRPRRARRDGARQLLPGESLGARPRGRGDRQADRIGSRVRRDVRRLRRKAERVRRRKGTGRRRHGSRRERERREIERFLLKEGAEKAWYALAPNESVVTREDRFRVGACDGRYVVTVSASLVQARGEVRLAAEGDCHCAEVKSGVRIGRFSVLGVAPLTFGNLTRKSNDTWTLACTMGRPHYRVVAPCCTPKDGTVDGSRRRDAVRRQDPTPRPRDRRRRRLPNRRAALRPGRGLLRKLLEWEERELERQRERHADEKTLAWRKAEIRAPPDEPSAAASTRCTPTRR